MYEDLQLKDKYDILPIFVDLMEINDIGVFHFGQDMNFFLNILPRHSSSRRLQSFLFNKLCCIFVTSVLFQYSKNCGKLAAEKGEIVNSVKIYFLTFNSVYICRNACMYIDKYSKMLIWFKKHFWEFFITNSEFFVTLKKMMPKLLP